MKLIDLTGHVFGKLTVIARHPTDKKMQARWLCACECGKQTIASGYDLRHGKYKSCSCKKFKDMLERSTTHGMSKTKEYRTWNNMKNRCYNHKVKCFDRYGALGVTVCDSWKNSFETFFNDMGFCPENHSIDRINNNLGYSKENCRWATLKTQSVNKKRTIYATINNIKKPLKTWCDDLGLPYNIIRMRVYALGWEPEKAITKPINHNKTI